MRHDMTIQSLDASSALPALMRSILLSVIGEEDSTCIVKINDEERRASETYVLSGRRLPAGSLRGLVIITLKIGGKRQNYYLCSRKPLKFNMMKDLMLKMDMAHPINRG